MFFPEPELSNIAYVILSESAFANAFIPGVAGDRQRRLSDAFASKG